MGAEEPRARCAMRPAMTLRRVAALALIVAAGAALAAAVPPRPAPAALHQALASILAKPEYQPAAPSRMQRLAERLAERLSRLVLVWGPAATTLMDAWPILYWALVCLLILAAVLLVYHICITLRLMFGERQVRQRSVVVAAVADPEDLLGRAADLARRGRYAEAIAALHAALVRFLDRRGILRFDSSRTNWEVLDAVQARPQLRAEMEPLTRQLDPILYGSASTTQDDYRVCEDHVHRAWDLVLAAGEAGG